MVYMVYIVIYKNITGSFTFIDFHKFDMGGYLVGVCFPENKLKFRTPYLISKNVDTP